MLGHCGARRGLAGRGRGAGAGGRGGFGCLRWARAGSGTAGGRSRRPLGASRPPAPRFLSGWISCFLLWGPLQGWGAHRGGVRARRGAGAGPAPCCPLPAVTPRAGRVQGRVWCREAVARSDCCSQEASWWRCRWLSRRVRPRGAAAEPSAPGTAARPWGDRPRGISHPSPALRPSPHPAESGLGHSMWPVWCFPLTRQHPASSKMGLGARAGFSFPSPLSPGVLRPVHPWLELAAACPRKGKSRPFEVKRREMCAWALSPGGDSCAMEV